MEAWRCSWMLALKLFLQAEDGIRVPCVTGVQTCALPISHAAVRAGSARVSPREAAGVEEAGPPAASVGETRAEPARTEAWASLRLRDKLLGWLGIEIEAHQLSGAWLAPGKASVAGAFVGALVMLGILFFAPLDASPLIYFQF